MTTPSPFRRRNPELAAFLRNLARAMARDHARADRAAEEEAGHAAGGAGTIPGENRCDGDADRRTE